MKKSEFIAKELDITLDKEYANFLDVYGHYINGKIHINGFPCVITITRMLKDKYKLDKPEVVLKYNISSDVIIILNNKTGKIYTLSLPYKLLGMRYDGNLKLISNSFNDWFEGVKNDIY